MIRLKVDYTNVVAIDEASGKLLFDLPYNAALQLAAGLRIQALKAEEIAKADGLALDHAFMLRAGLPWGMTEHPQIVDAAKTAAAHDSQLRKIIPITPDARRADVGVPKVVKG